MGKFITFCIVNQSNNLLFFQICQSFVITICKSLTNYFFHNGSCAVFVEFIKCFVIFLSINKFNIYGYKTLSHQQGGIDNAPNTAVPVNEWMRVFKCKMRSRNTFYDILAAAGIIFREHFFNSPYALFRRRSNMAPDANVLITSAESAGNIVANV